MERLVSRKKTIEYLILFVAVIILCMIWPLKLIRVNYTAKSDEVIARESDPISVEYNMAQMFDGIEGELKSVDLYVCNDMAGQIMTFRMYNADHEQIFERFLSVPDTFIAPGFINIPVRYDMKGGNEYSFIIEGLTTDLYAAYEDRMTTTSSVNYFMAYGGAEVPEYDLIVRYNYSRPFSLLQILITAVVLILICTLTIVLANRCKDEQIELRRALQWILNPALMVSAVLAFYVIMIKRLFGFNTKNDAFLTLGVWMLILFGLLIVNYGKINIPDRFCENISFSKITHVLRIISLASVLWYCYEYMNGLYNIQHYYSTSKLVIAFAFYLIFTFTRKELMIVPNAVWLIAGPILGYIYYRPQIGVAEMEELYRLNGWVIAIVGFVVINLIYSIIRVIKKEVQFPHINLLFIIPFLVFSVGICALSNGRNWPWLLVVICILLAYRLAFTEERERFSEEICSGIVLNFYMMVYFSLRHRPYYFYQYYRYYMGYHTVTVTAYYLAMILCATWTRLYDVMKRSTDIKSLYPRMFTFGMSATYLIFTMSRTGFLSVGCMMIFAFVIISFIIAKKERIILVLKYAAIVVISVAYMFPVTFFLTDVVPRISNDPITFEYEVRDFTFTKGMPYDDYDYMTIEQFVREFKRKVFNIEPVGDVHIDVFDPFLIRAYASEAEVDEEIHEDTPSEDEDVTDMSNGRIDIFKSYIAVWNLWGHEEMEALLPNGEMAIHAHNTFLQVAHDHGIVFGIYFVLYIGYVIILSLVGAIRKRDDAYAMFCPALLVCFVMAGMVEWLLHPCNPFGLAAFLTMMSLVYKDTYKEDEKSNQC